MSDKFYIWRPRPFKTQLIPNFDLAKPIALDSDMYRYTEDDSDGNAVFDQIGSVYYPDPINRQVYEVTYYGDYDGPRENESKVSKEARERYLLDHAEPDRQAGPVTEEAPAEPEKTEEKEPVDGVATDVAGTPVIPETQPAAPAAVPAAGESTDG